MSVMDLKEQIDVSIDGERVAVLDAQHADERVGSEEQPRAADTARVHVKAGPHRVSAAFIQSFEALPDDLVIPVENTLADVSIELGASRCCRTCAT